MLQDGKVLGTHLAWRNWPFKHDDQHSYHIIQYVINQFAC